MRRSREETAETRRNIVKTAGIRFRQNGICETGLADLMESAGPDARRVLPALRLEGPTRLRSFGGRVRGQNRRDASFRLHGQGPQSA